jgi:predicted Zn finger-like uncharacterized protein
MSLATRCAACGTVFRVVQDQLKVSEGWVCCGRCGDVFNALEGLFDLERETAPAWTPSQRGALDLLPSSADEHRAQSSAAAAMASSEPQAAVGPESIQDTEVDTRADSQIEARLLERDEFDDDERVGRGEVSVIDEASTDGPAPDAPAPWPEPAPAFVQQADRAARWQRPRVRLALALAAVALGLMLGAQVALWQRDTIAARWPLAAPLLAALCEPLACRLEPLRRLEGLAVESSGLTQLGELSLYQLRVSLRNRDTLALRTPALDLTMTDSRGEVVARRVLGGRDFGSETPLQVAAGAELALQAVLDTGERRVSGYSVEIFYP